MKTELENRLRAELTLLASEVDGDLDLNALIDRGHRAYRERTRRRTLGAVAAAAAIAVAAWAGLLPRTQNGVPEPMQSPSVSAVEEAKATIELASLNQEFPALYRTIQVSLVGGVATFTGHGRTASTASTASTPSPAQLATLRLDGSSVMVQRIDAHLSVGLVADRVEWLSADPGEDLGGWSTPFELIPGTNLTAFGLVTEKPADEKAAPLANLIWRSLDGSMHALGNQQVSTATLKLSDDDYTVFYAPATKHIGFFTTLGGLGPFSNNLVDDSQVVKADGSISKGGGYQNTALGMLPKGASDPKVTTTVQGAEVMIGTLQPDGRLVFVARFDSKKQLADGLVASVTYTGADGRRVTYRNK
ncbi:hypothetical protein [Micropruina sp.]|uniref:hypothetical protein n=1 Tax=Micropruina sp. TaxID=2737536 RepID=UPI0039E59F38